jgi:DNA modification methylase
MIDIRLGDCRDLLKTIPDGSVDCIITDPPYPEIDRDYGRMTEAGWHEMMRSVVAQARRVLKSTGSAVFILQPNSRKVGSMRPWLFEFQAWACREWNMVQDAYWWNHAALPTAGAPDKGMMRQSVKSCVWLGEPDCYRNQEAVLWEESDGNKAARLAGRCDHSVSPSGRRSGTTPRVMKQGPFRVAAFRRGGVTPFNILLIPNGSNRSGHPAATPELVCDWWTRYICTPGGTILDPFMGSGTTGLSAIKYNCSYIGFEQMPRYFDISKARLDAAMAELPLFAADR